MKKNRIAPKFIQMHVTLLIIPSIYSWFEKRKVEAEM